MDAENMLFTDFPQESIKCPVCSNVFDGGVHTPHVLPCGDNICKGCLNQNLNQNKQCPLCREALADHRGFPVNLFLRDAACSSKIKSRNTEPRTPNERYTAGNCKIHKEIQMQLRCVGHKKWICCYCQVENHRDCHTITVVEAIDRTMREAKQYYEGKIKKLEKTVGGHTIRIEHYRSSMYSLKKKREIFKSNIRKIRREQARYAKIDDVNDVDMYCMNQARLDNASVPVNTQSQPVFGRINVEVFDADADADADVDDDNYEYDYEYNSIGYETEENYEEEPDYDDDDDAVLLLSPLQE